MWSFLLYHGFSSLLLVVLLIIILVVTVYSYRENFIKNLEYSNKTQKVLKEKKWEEFLEDPDGSDELLTATRSIVLEFSKDINREHTAQILDKQVQISALQSQINPHFLYNTLESIRGQALTVESFEIAKMAEALAAFFRYSIDQKGNFVTLQEEINNVKNYILIQEYRFHNKFGSIIDVDEDDENVYDYLLPKLTIQPIVENAIYHGLEIKGEEGCVIITINTTKKRLLITVSDDGNGMSQEVLDGVNRKLHSTDLVVDDRKNIKGTGIALINVNKRIKLIFGSQYGIQVYSTLNRGTDVEIVLPLVKENKNLLDFRSTEIYDGIR